MNSPIRRIELAVATVFLGANLVLSVAFTEMYPFSAAPMFAGAPRHYSTIRVTDPAGAELPPAVLGFHIVDRGYPYLGALEGAVSVNPAGVVLDRAMIERRVRRYLSAVDGLPFVDVEQRVYGSRRDGTFGLVDLRQFRVPGAGGPK